MNVTLLDRERTVAPPGFNRWLIPPAALAVHLCIGQAYATSVYKASLVDHFDSSLTAVGAIFSIAIVMLGLSAAVFGTWVDTGGPRRAMATAAAFWSTGFLVGALGIATSQLWLVYLGYGVIGGIGLGIGYISPVSTLIKWFPDRPGLATGMAIMGFGGGALVASPLSQQLLGAYDPSYDVATGVATGAAVAKLFVTLGLAYLVVMLFGAWLIRVPAADWRPAGWDPTTVRSKSLVTTSHVSAAGAIRTPQFWLLWVVLFCNVTAGIGILEQAAPMIQDFFRSGADSSVAAGAAAGFVGLLSLCNMAGRFVWSSTSDVIGRKPIYLVYLGLGILLYLALALTGSSSVALFVVLAGGIISFYGGGFATVPAYLRDLFGTFQVGAIHGRLLTAWSAAGVAGPLIINGFLDARGEPGALVAADYRPALLTMVGVLAVGLLANLLVRPVAERHHVDPSRVEKAAPATSADSRATAPARTALLPVAWTVVATPWSTASTRRSPRWPLSSGEPPGVGGRLGGVTLDVQLVGTTTQMAIVTLRPGQVVYSEAGKFLFSSGDVTMETKLSAPGQENAGGMGGLLRGAMQAGRRMMTGESLAVTHFETKGGDGLLAFAGVIPGEMRALELTGSDVWFAEKDAFVAAEAGVNQSIAFSGLSQGLMGGEGFLLQKFEGRGTLLVGGSGDFIDINPAEYGGEIVVDTGCVVAWDDRITYGIKAVGRMNRQGVMNALLGGEGFTLATLRGNGRVILQSTTLAGLATALAKSARMTGSTQNGQTGLGSLTGIFGGNE